MFLVSILLSFIRFLLARHKAAIDVYNEAVKMTDNDWVIVINIVFLHTFCTYIKMCIYLTTVL